MYQSDCAAKIGVSQSFLSQLLGGTRRFSWPTAKRIARDMQADFPGVTPSLLMDATPDQLRKIFKVNNA